MKQYAWPVVLVLALITAFFIFPYFNNVQLPDEQFSSFGSDTVRAQVIQITEQGDIDLGGHVQTYQIARVNILNGKYAGIPMEIDYGKRQLRTNDYLLSVGDKVIVSISKTPANVVNAYQSPQVLDLI